MMVVVLAGGLVLAAAIAPGPGRSQTPQPDPVLPPLDGPITGRSPREPGTPGAGPVWLEDADKVERGVETQMDPDEQMAALRALGTLDVIRGRGLDRDKSTLDQWVSLGPVGGFGDAGSPEMNGRISGIQMVPETTGYTMFVGACQGGLWRMRSTAFAYWTDIGVNLPNPSVRAIAVDPDDHDHIFVGTGDHRRYLGAGMFVTADGGATWDQVDVPVPTPRYYYRILYLGNSSNPATQRMVAACSEGIVYSSDGGQTWQNGRLAQGGILDDYWTDVVAHPLDPSILFAPRCDVFAGGNSGFYRSDDYGETWVRMTDPDLPASDSWYRSTMAISPSDPDILVGMVSYPNRLVGVYKSTDGVVDWTVITSNLIDGDYIFGSDQIYHAQALTIHPLDPDHIIIGGVSVAESLDGGATWLLGYDALEAGHADVTQLYFSPLTGNDILWICNDGGIYYHYFPGDATYDALGNGTTGLVCSEIDHLAARRDIRGIGLQDNGTLRSDDAGLTWEQIAPADGADFEIFDPEQNNVFYTVGVVPVEPRWRIYRKYGQGVSEFMDHPGENRFFMFYQPLNNTLYTALPQSIIEIDADAGVGKGELAWTYTAGNFQGGDYLIRRFWGSPAREDVFFVSYWTPDERDLTIAHKEGPDWVIDHFEGFNPADGNIDWVAPSREWPGEAWVAVESDPGNPKIYHLRDFGAVKTDITGNLAVLNRVHCLEVMPFDPDVIWAGTDLGVYRTLDGGESWEPYMEGLPVGKCAELKLVVDPDHQGQHTLALAMDGKGAWTRAVSMPDIVFVDPGNTSGTEDGSFEHPFNTLAEGVAAAPSGAIVAMHTFVYDEPQTISRNLKLVTWGGVSNIR